MPALSLLLVNFNDSVFNFSNTCLTSGSNKCISCTTDPLNRDDESSPTGGTCPCKTKYYDKGISACSPCHYSWFYFPFLLINSY